QPRVSPCLVLAGREAQPFPKRGLGLAKALEVVKTDSQVGHNARIILLVAPDFSEHSDRIFPATRLHEVGHEGRPRLDAPLVEGTPPGVYGFGFAPPPVL